MVLYRLRKCLTNKEKKVKIKIIKVLSLKNWTSYTSKDQIRNKL